MIHTDLILQLMTTKQDYIVPQVINYIIIITLYIIIILIILLNIWLAI